MNPDISKRVLNDQCCHATENQSLVGDHIQIHLSQLVGVAYKRNGSIEQPDTLGANLKALYRTTSQAEFGIRCAS